MITLYLPFPPTVNGMYNGKVRRFKSDGYKDWITRAAKAASGFTKHKPITEDCECIISLVKPDNRRRDVANYEKAVGDFLVYAGILADDSLIVKNTQQWVKGDFECRVELIPIGKFTPIAEHLKKISVAFI